MNDPELVRAEYEDESRFAVRAAAQELPFADGSFDCAVAAWVPTRHSGVLVAEKVV